MLHSFPTLEEIQRVEAVRRLKLLDTPAEERFDRITRLASQRFKVSFAAITLIDAERKWFKSRYGIELTEIPRSNSICTHTLNYPDLLVVNDLQQDARFKTSPYVTGEPFLRFYAGQALRDKEGYLVGTLCVLDQQPRNFSSYEKLFFHQLVVMAETELATGTTTPVHEIAPRRSENQFLNRGADSAPLARILVMDDEQFLQRVVKRILEKFGYEVTLAGDGYEALDRYREGMAQERKFDLVLMDLTVPNGMGGLETIQRLQALDPSVKAVVSSGYSHDEILQTYHDWGFQGMVAKPYRAEELVQAVEAALRA